MRRTSSEAARRQVRRRQLAATDLLVETVDRATDAAHASLQQRQQRDHVDNCGRVSQPTLLSSFGGIVFKCEKDSWASQRSHSYLASVPRKLTWLARALCTLLRFSFHSKRVTMTMRSLYFRSFFLSPTYMYM